MSTDETSAARTGPDVVGAGEPVAGPTRDGTPTSAAAPDAPLIPTRSADDSDTGWGEHVESNDDRLLRDVPPHW